MVFTGVVILWKFYISIIILLKVFIIKTLNMADGFMAIVRNTEFDGYSGKLGNIIFRTRYGKTVAYRVPENFKKSESEASMANRKKLKPMSQFASNICSLPELKQIWSIKSETKATSAFHKVEKMNAQFFDSNRPTIKNRIVPMGFGCQLDDMILNKDEIRLNISFPDRPLTEEEEMKKLKRFLVISIICFYDPVKKEDEYFTFYNVYRQITDWEKGTSIEARYEFSEEEGKIFSEYRNSILYYTVIACDAEGYFLGNSLSYSKEFDNITGLLKTIEVK